MNRRLKTYLTRLALILCLSFSAIQAQTTAFTYQGRLTDGGAPASGLYDLQFKLFDAATGGNQVGATLTRDDVNVTNGAFSTSLDFGGAAFPGASAGYNARGNNNSFFGQRSGYNTTSGAANAFFGTSAGQANTSGFSHAFFGAAAGESTQGGFGNTFIGYNAAFRHQTGDSNTFVGFLSGNQTNGSNNTLLGASAIIVNPNLSYATAIGAGAEVGTNNTVVLGRRAGQDRVLIPGPLDLLSIPGGGSGPLCTDVVRVSHCSSSLRYKANVQPLASSLNVINRLRPVTFDWKGRDEHDLGLIAEEVAEIEPLLTFRNEKGEIEGVKYAQISAVLINAVKEQQAEIEQLKKIVCADHPGAAVCGPRQ